MTKNMLSPKNRGLLRMLLLTGFIASAMSLASVTPACVFCVDSPFYDGGGIQEGIERAQAISGLTDKGLRETIIEILFIVLGFMGLAAVVVIVIAGIMMVVSGGDEQLIGRAKKIIFWAIIGLLVILFASGIVGFIANDVAEQVGSGTT